TPRRLSYGSLRSSSYPHVFDSIVCLLGLCGGCSCRDAAPTSLLPLSRFPRGLCGGCCGWRLACRTFYGAETAGESPRVHPGLCLHRGISRGGGELLRRQVCAESS